MSGVLAVVEATEELVGQQGPQFRGLGPELLGQSGAMHRALVVAHQLRTEHQVVQHHQWQEVIFVEHFVEVINVLGGIVGPTECLHGPLHKIPLQGLQRRQPNRAVGLDIVERQQCAPQYRRLRKGWIISGDGRERDHANGLTQLEQKANT